MTFVFNKYDLFRSLNPNNLQSSLHCYAVKYVLNIFTIHNLPGKTLSQDFQIKTFCLLSGGEFLQSVCISIHMDQ